MTPTRGLARAVNMAAQAFLRTVSKVVGGEVVDDAIAFFPAFDGMEEGFRERAGAVLELLADHETAFVLVAAPRRDMVEEARTSPTELAEADIPVRALIVNRVHPRFTDASVAGPPRRGPTPSPAPTSAASTPTWPTSPLVAASEEAPPRAASPGRWRRRR